MRSYDDDQYNRMGIYGLPLEKEERKHYRPERSEDTRKGGIPYRPETVDQMKQMISDPENEDFGTMIKAHTELASRTR